MAPSLVLIFLAASVAMAVEHFVKAAEPARATGPGEGFGNPAIRIGGPEYPRQVIDSDSFIVRVVRPVRRIVSQYWSIDEYVYSVVPPERVVAVSETAYRAAVSNVSQYVQRYRPTIATDPERVLRLDPDLLMVSDNSRADFCALIREAKIPINRVFTTFTTLQQIADTIRLTGYLTGEDQSAAMQTQQFWSDVERAKARKPPGAKPPRVLGLSGGASYGTNTIFDDVVRTLGAINVGAEGGLDGYANINSEQIARWNPEWIISGADRGKTREVLAKLQSDPAIALTDAARRGHIAVFEYNIFLPMSPFTRLLVTALAETLYG